MSAKDAGRVNAPTGERAMSIALHDPKLWPLRMTRVEVATVCRVSVCTLNRRIREGRFIRPDGDGTWPRMKVRTYVLGGVEEVEKRYARHVARQPLAPPGAGLRARRYPRG